MPRASMNTMPDFTGTPFDAFNLPNESMFDIPAFMFPSHSSMSPASPFSGPGDMAIDMFLRMMLEHDGMMSHPFMGGSRSVLGGRSGSGRGSRSGETSSEGNIAARMAALLSTDRDFGPEDYAMLLQLDATVQKRGVSATEKRQFIRIRAATRHDAHDCLICQEKFKTGRAISVLTCKHEFCEECLDRWFAQNRTCPVCRNEVDATPPDAVQKPAVKYVAKTSPPQIRQRETNPAPPTRPAAPSSSSSHVPRPTFTARSAPAEFRSTRVVPSTASRVFGDNGNESRVPPPARTAASRVYDSGNYVPRSSVTSIPIGDRPPVSRSAAGQNAPAAPRSTSLRTSSHRSPLY